MSQFKDKNINFFHQSLPLLASDVDAFRETLNELDYEDLSEVCQLFANTTKYLAQNRCDQYSFDFSE